MRIMMRSSQEISVFPRLKIKHLPSWPARAAGGRVRDRGVPPLVGGFAGSPPKKVLKFYMPFGGI